MPSQELQWMAVPYDVEEVNGKIKARVAVCVTPRLQDATTADRTLNDYPDFADWPQKLANVGIALELDGIEIPAGKLTSIDDQPDSNVWNSVFRPTTLVRPFEYKPFTNYKILSFPVKNIINTMDATYKSLLTAFDGEAPKLFAKAPQFNADGQSTALKTLPPILAALSDVTPNSDTEGRLRFIKDGWEKDGERIMRKRMRNEGLSLKNETRGIERQEIKKLASPAAMMFQPVDVSTQLGGLEMVELYHAARTFSTDDGEGPKRTRRSKRAKSTRPKFDFHQVVGVLREFPVVMRRLGLIRHFEFDLPESANPSGKVRCKITWPGGSTTTQTLRPWTAYALKSSGDPQFWQFLPRPDNDSEITGPLLCLDNTTHFDVVQVDVDSVAVKTLNYTRSIAGRYTKTIDTKDQNTDAEPPSIRGTGLQLIRVNRGLKLAKMLVRSAQNWNRIVSNTEVTLYADDLLRGYRLDVYDETASAWQSLMRRNAKYSFPLATGDLKSKGIHVLDEEGVLTMGATRPVESDDELSQQQLYAHETVAQWEGWSLVVPPIGQHIGTEDELAPPGSKQSPPIDFEYQVETDVAIVPGSLPRLRFGRKYRMRARTVDIAGNGPKYDELNPNDFTCTTELIRFLRWDPVVSPTLAMKAHPIEGESLELMVIRNYNADVDDSVEVATNETNERQVFPPLAAQQILERHGLFDKSPVGQMKGDNATYNVIAGKLGDLPSRWYTRNDAGDLVPEAQNDTPPANEQKAKTAIRYPYVPGGPSETPYLTDPLARTLCLDNVPGVAGGQIMQVDLNGATMAAISHSKGVVTVAFGNDTSSPGTGSPSFDPVQSILIKLAEGEAAPDWNAGSRTLTIFLPKSEQAWIKFSSGLGADQAEGDANLDLHGHKGTLSKSGLPGITISKAARGLNWLVSPSRTLHLMHATQKPLKKPNNKKGSVVERGFGYTRARIDLPDTYVHGRSTQKIDMFAEWDMWDDNLNKPAPELLKQSAYFYEQHVEDRLVDKLSNNKVQEFGDTKYRAVTYVPLATTRFREHMPANIRTNKDDLNRKGSGKELDILSSKRPDSLKLRYVVPSYRWVEDEKTFDGTIVRSTRKGGGLRLYMDRPWYSSGNGELVGVVLYSTKKFVASNPKGEGKGIDNYKAPAYKKGGGINAMQVEGMNSLLSNGKLEIPEEIQPYVSQWGLDPIWLSAPTPSDNSPRATNFREPKTVLDSVSLAEFNRKQRFSVVGYEPKFDTERQLWYCDIEMDPGKSYYPFVRLSLCRLQPKSLANPQNGEDVYCSPVTQSEFCQLAPDREAMARVEADRLSVTVQVSGHTYRTNSSGQLGSEIEVTIEKRSAGAGDQDLGWVPVTTQRIDRINAANIWGGLLKTDESVDGVQHRVVIKEYEQFYADPSDPKARETNLGSKTGGGEVNLELDRRIVYADVLPLY